jgi:hypothetical protein
MQVSVDNVWSTPSTLHMRVTVWGPGHEWRHKYDVAVPLEDIPEEALWGLTERAGVVPRDMHQLPLF